LAAVPALEIALQSDPKGSVRAEAARSLGRLRAEDSAKLLAAALLAGHPALTEGAAEALDALGQGASLQGKTRAAFLVGLGRFSEAVAQDESAVDLLLLRAALCRDGSAFPPMLLETLYRHPSPRSAPFLEHRLLGLRRALTGGPTPDVYQKLQAEAARIEASLALLQAEGPQTEPQTEPEAAP
jgi:HEAT repeat protein